MAVGWKYLYFSSVGFHIVALILIRWYLFWFYFLQSERNIESKNLPDKVTNLGIFTIWLASSGCLPHKSSVWPWSGAPKVRLYGTFMSGLRQNDVVWGFIQWDVYDLDVLVWSDFYSWIPVTTAQTTCTLTWDTNRPRSTAWRTCRSMQRAGGPGSWPCHRVLGWFRAGRDCMALIDAPTIVIISMSCLV